MSGNRLIFGLAAVLIVATGLLSAAAVYMFTAGQQPGSVLVQSGQAAVGGPFEAIDDQGNPVSNETLAGKPYIMFFGFTRCPDICPTKLAEITMILDNLGEDAERLGAYFVSVDPEHDTPEILSEYIDSFHPDITGLTGTVEQIRDMAKAYRVYYKKVDIGGDYTVDHSTVVYLFDDAGAFHSTVNVERPIDDVIAEVRRVF